MKAYLPARDRR